MRLEGRTALITGGASGLGRAIAVRFAAEGAKVVVSDIREEPIWDQGKGKPTAQLILESGGDALYVQADVSKAEDVDRLFHRTLEKHGALDILVNSAAIFPTGGILDTTEEVWDSVMRVNMRGQFFCCKSAIKQMITQPKKNEVRGRIVNISSQHGMVGPPDFCAYAVSKAGTAQLTRQLAVDFGRKGIIVNAVAPGRIITGTHPGEVEYLTKDVVDDGTKYSLSRTPFYRLGRPEDVAGAALFLASDDCTFMSGHNLLVDGGWMAY